LKGAPEFASVAVTLGAQDVTDLAVVSKPGARITGKMTFDTGTPPADKTPTDLRLFVYANTYEPLSAGTVTMNDDWTFE
ncbi:hypothetical protein, partial [Salmonella sp. SAL4357]|uniref:hypothetical protein n=1 Tax=Salmonella sp. SAL4357 TaxID=3159878 RepID=UPI00397B7634